MGSLGAGIGFSVSVQSMKNASFWLEESGSVTGGRDHECS